MRYSVALISLLIATFSDVFYERGLTTKQHNKEATFWPDVFSSKRGPGLKIKEALVFGGSGKDFVMMGERNGNLILESRKRKILEIEENSNKVKINSAKLFGSLSVLGSLSSSEINQWTLWSLDLFDAGPSYWEPPEFSSCGSTYDVFLGGHCKFGATTAAKTFRELPLHSHVRIIARVHYLDRWEGESLFMKLDDAIVWSGSWRWCPGPFKSECIKHGIDVCGSQYPDRLSVVVQAEIIHKQDSLVVSFGSNFPTSWDACTASWGLDDVALYLQLGS